MASTVARAAKAIYAEPAFIPKGPINSGRFNLVREIMIGTALGTVGGLVWKAGGAAAARWCRLCRQP
jgi:hypothetical protein